jgi:MFS family permease
VPLRRILLLVGAIVFVDTMFFAALTPLLPHYADRFELSKLGAGVLGAAYPAGVLVGGIPSGVLATRVGVRPTTVGGLLVMTATTAIFGFAGSVALLDAARFAQGVASACAWTAGFAWLLREAPAQRRGEVMGAAIGTAIVGALFGPVLGGIASEIGTRAAFGGVGALTLCLTVWAVATPAPAASGGSSLRRLWASFASPRVRAGCWFVMLPALLFGTMSVLAPLRLSRLGWGGVAIGSVFLVSAAFEATLAPIVGRVSDRQGRRLPLAVGLAGSAAMAALLPWPQRAWLLAAAIVLAATCFGTFWTPAMSLLIDAGEQVGLDHALAFALINLAWAPGQALGSAAGGGIARATSDKVPFLLLGVACAVSLTALGLRGRRVAVS